MGERERRQDTSETTSLLSSTSGSRRRINPRYTLAILGCLGMIIEYSQRVNLSVAIVAMVRPLNASNDSREDFCPENLNYTKPDDGEIQGEFEWDRWVQGLVLGGFFWGYAATNLLGGRASEYLGGKAVFGMGLAVSSLLTLLSPPLAKASVQLFIVTRVLLGAAQGVTFPSMSTMLAAWCLPIERAKFTTIVYSGYQLGTVIGLLVSGWLASSTFLGGWPASFYVFGVAGIIWTFAWCALVYERPEDHPGLSPERLMKLQCQQGAMKGAKTVSVQWRPILTSVPFWGFVLVSLGNDYGFYTLLTELPTYLHDVQHYDLASNGLISALPYFLMWVWSYLWAGLMVTLSEREMLSIVNVRRISTAIALWGPMCGLLVCAGLQCQAAVALAMLCVGGMFNGAVNSGYLCSHQDMAPNLAGTLLGFANTFGAVTGIVAPAVTGYIVDNIPSLWAWRVVFLVACVIYLVTTTFYLFVATAEVQPWNDPEEEVESRAIHPPTIHSLSAGEVEERS